MDGEFTFTEAKDFPKKIDDSVTVVAKTSNFHNLEDKQIVHTAFEEEICFFFYVSLFG